VPIKQLQPRPECVAFWVWSINRLIRTPREHVGTRLDLLDPLACIAWRGRRAGGAGAIAMAFRHAIERHDLPFAMRLTLDS
jgi:hypothetical protein